jgi:hypothetical protein
MVGAQFNQCPFKKEKDLDFSRPQQQQMILFSARFKAGNQRWTFEIEDLKVL